MAHMCNVVQLHTQANVDITVDYPLERVYGIFTKVGISAHTVVLIMWALSAKVTKSSTVAMTMGIM